MSSSVDFASLIGPVARKLLGEPNQALSSPRQLRFGSHGSLSVEIAGEKQGTWYDHERNEGGGVLDLLKREKKLANGEALNWLRRELNAEIPAARPLDSERQNRRRIVATYDYQDADGQLSFQVVRYEPKEFRQRRPDGNGGWHWNVQGLIPLPYRLPELLASASEPTEPVFIVEGEKDVQALLALGLVATCNPGGAGSEPKLGMPFKSKWSATFAQYFVGRDVIILPDNDKVGQSHAQSIARSLTGTASRVRICNLPGLAPKGDVSDWIAAGGTRERLQELVRQAPNFSADPPADPPPDQRAMIWLAIGSDSEIATRVTADLQQRFGDLVYCEGNIWRYEDTHWTAIPDECLWLAAARHDGALFTTPAGEISGVRLNKSRIESILTCMRPALTRHDFFGEAAAGINCLSGFIRFGDDSKATLEPHSAEHRCRHVLPGRWPVALSQEQWHHSLLARLLNGCFKDDEDKDSKVDLLAEVAGIAALGGATALRMPKALVLKGERAENGKSQVLDVLRSLLPKSAVCSISPARFSDRTFACHLTGKLLNAPDELANGEAIASDMFKQIITGEPLMVRDVYQSAFEFRPVAQHVYATNTLPSFKGGMDRGVRRRVMVLTFNRVIPVDERVNRIGQRVGAEEADLLLDWAVRGACRVLARQGFIESTSSVDALQDWMFSSDPVLSWLASNEVEFSKNAWVPETKASVAYDRFRRWASDEGYATDKLPAINGFSQRVVAAAAEKGVSKKRTAAGSFFVGLACIGAGTIGRGLR